MSAAMTLHLADNGKDYADEKIEDESVEDTDPSRDDEGEEDEDDEEDDEEEGDETGDDEGDTDDDGDEEEIVEETEPSDELIVEDEPASPAESSAPTSFVGLFGGPESVLGLDDLRDQIDPAPPEALSVDDAESAAPSIEDRVNQHVKRDELLRREIDELAESLLGLVTRLDAPARTSAADILVPHRVNYVDGPTMSSFAAKQGGKDSFQLLGLPKAKQDGRKRDEKDREEDEKETDRLYGRGLREKMEDKQAVSQGASMNRTAWAQYDQEKAAGKDPVLPYLPVFERCAAVVARLEGKARPRVVANIRQAVQAMRSCVGRVDSAESRGEYDRHVLVAKALLDRYLEQRQGMPRTAASWAVLEKVASQKVAVDIPHEWQTAPFVGEGDGGEADQSGDPESGGPAEDDITTEDDQTWYQSGKVYFRGDREGLKAKMDQDQFWPNVWVISDHGNAQLITDLT